MDFHSPVPQVGRAWRVLSSMCSEADLPLTLHPGGVHCNLHGACWPGELFLWWRFLQNSEFFDIFGNLCLVPVSPKSSELILVSGTCTRKRHPSGWAPRIISCIAPEYDTVADHSRSKQGINLHMWIWQVPFSRTVMWQQAGCHNFIILYIHICIYIYMFLSGSTRMLPHSHVVLPKQGLSTAWANN